MSHILLVGTVHEEVGRANALELTAILERFEPDAIFLEVPLASFDDYYESFSRYNLESLAVRQYLRGREVKLVPVDLPTPEREFFEEHEHLHMAVRRESSEYRQLMATHCEYTRIHGFGYLNSKHCDQLWVDVYEEIFRSLDRLKDARLFRIQASWAKKLDERRAEMMRGIVQYCEGSQFTKGVFLFGAAHRRKIIDLAQAKRTIGNRPLQWDWKVEV